MKMNVENELDKVVKILKEKGFVVQAESFEEAKKLAEAYVQDASLDTTDYPEIVQDVLEVAEYGIIDVEQ